MIKCICEICKKEFYTYPYRIRNQRHIFCSQKCYGIYLLGKKRSKKITKKIVNTRKLRGYWHSNITKIKIGIGNKGKKRTKIMRNRISDIQKGKHHSPKTEFKKGNHPNTEFKKGERCREKHPNWKGGIYHSKGRFYILSPFHPFRSKTNYAIRSHLIIEKAIGRYLTSEEVVHHINNNPSDDRIENLKILTRSEHARYHNLNPLT